MQGDKGKCPICGESITLTGEYANNGRLIGSCGDAFTWARWKQGAKGGPGYKYRVYPRLKHSSQPEKSLAAVMKFRVRSFRTWEAVQSFLERAPSPGLILDTIHWTVENRAMSPYGVATYRGGAVHNHDNWDMPKWIGEVPDFTAEKCYRK